MGHAVPPCSSSHQFWVEVKEQIPLLKGSQRRAEGLSQNPAVSNACVWACAYTPGQTPDSAGPFSLFPSLL